MNMPTKEISPSVTTIEQMLKFFEDLSIEDLPDYLQHELSYLIILLENSVEHELEPAFLNPNRFFEE